MLSRSTVIRYARSILGKGLMALGTLWLLRALIGTIWPVLALAVFLVGLVVGVGVGIYKIWRYQQQRYQAQIRYEDRLARQFYTLAQRREGRISALEFAMHGRIDHSEAQRYLHEQAQAFGAYFERTLNGDIIYIFNLGMIFGVSSAPVEMPATTTPAERVWAYAEQAKLRQSLPTLPAVRGRAQEMPENITTIDVSVDESAVNE